MFHLRVFTTNHRQFQAIHTRPYLSYHFPPPPPPTRGVRINGFVYNNKVEGRLLYWIFWVGALIRVYVTLAIQQFPLKDSHI